MSVNEDEAARIALSHANRAWGYPRNGESLAILHEYTEQSEAAWAFCYNTRAYVASGDFMQSLIGNGVVIVSKSSGKATFMASGLSSQEALEEWQASEDG